MKKAVFAGTFDPFTIGHKDVVNQALNVLELVADGRFDLIYYELELTIEPC